MRKGKLMNLQQFAGEDFNKLPWQQRLQSYASDPTLRGQEMARINNVLAISPNNPTAARWYSQVNAAGNGIDINSIVNGTADLSKFSYQTPTASEGVPSFTDFKKTLPQYQSRYDDFINQGIAAIQNVKPFEYNPANDPAYQAYLAQYQQQGANAFRNVSNQMSAATLGYDNTASVAAASQAQNSYLQQGQSALPDFMNAAYQKYSNNVKSLYDNLNTYMELDDKDYSRFMDGIEQDYKNFEIEYNGYFDKLELKEKEITDAIRRTELNGTVSNSDALILGVVPGTLSQSAKTRAAEYQEWLDKQKVELENAKLEADYQKQLAAKYSKPKSSAGSATEGTVKLTSTERSKVNTEVKAYNTVISSDKYKQSTAAQQKKIIEDYVEKIRTYYEEGSITENAAITILDEIINSEEYNRFLGESYSDDLEAQRINR